MPKPDVLGIQAFSTDALLQDWWEFTLVAIISASGLLGIIAFVYFSYQSIRNRLKVSGCRLFQARILTSIVDKER
jgi:hypothetical protein